MKVHPIDEVKPDDVSIETSSQTESDYSSFSVNAEDSDEENLSKTIDYLRAFKYALESANYAYEFATDKLEKEENQKSQAQINDEDRYKYLVSKINNVISAYDAKMSKYGTDLDKYLNFLGQKTFSENSDITPEDIRALRATLSDEDLEDQIGGGFREKFFSAARKIVSFTAGFIIKSEDVKKYNKLSKDKKKKIELLRKFIKLDQNDSLPYTVKQEQYEELNGAFIALTREEQSRSKRSIFRILATQMHNEKLFTSETASKIASSVMHPFTKIVNNKDMGVLEKSARVVMKAGEKGIKGAKFVVGEALNSGRSAARDLVKHPAMTLYRVPMALFNTAEAAIAQAQALAEEDPTKKIELQEKAKQKLGNIAYQAEQGGREAVASGVTAGVAIANAGSFGAPLVVSHAAAAAIHGIVAASEIADHLSTAKEGIDHFIEAREEIKQIELTKEEKTRGRRGNIDLSFMPAEYHPTSMHEQHDLENTPVNSKISAAERMQATLDKAARRESMGEEIHPVDTPRTPIHTNSKVTGHDSI